MGLHMFLKYIYISKIYLYFSPVCGTISCMMLRLINNKINIKYYLIILFPGLGLYNKNFFSNISRGDKFIV